MKSHMIPDLAIHEVDYIRKLDQRAFVKAFSDTITAIAEIDGMTTCEMFTDLEKESKQIKTKDARGGK